jgi:hypothetical protein
MTDNLSPGDRVRVKPLAAMGTILRVSERLRHTPYLVRVEGYGERGYAASDLAKMETPAPDTASATAAPVAAVRGYNGLWRCGVRGCWRTLDMTQPACIVCGCEWVLP